jgi:AcrR family transcriptional regulator
MDGFERRREQKKLDILEAALALFMEYGIKKISVVDIAKKANVSQVTIYNYFESKHNLIHEVFLYYINKTSAEFDQVVNSDLSFPEKIKKIIFDKKKIATEIHEELYQYFMREYTSEGSFIEKIYVEEALPRFIRLFEEGKEQGFVDPNLSNEAIIFFIHAINEYMQREDVYEKVLPLTEDIMNLIFFGIMGKKAD